MNQTISSSCFHFTGWTQNNRSDSFGKIVRILNGKEFKFKRNARQWIVDQGYRKETSLALSHFYVKTICFTETPIGFLKDYISYRGGFCIGMKKEWLLRNGGQNVMYVNSDHPNDYGRAVTELLCRHKTVQVEDVPSQEEAKIHSNLTLALIAATEDEAFHEEREWRLIRNDMNQFITEDYVKFQILDIDSI